MLNDENNSCSLFKLQRFDLNVEYQQFMFAFLLPTVLLVVSCFTLTVCQKSVVVGDDSKMRFKCFTNEDTGKLNTGHNASNLDGDQLWDPSRKIISYFFIS